VDGERIGRSQEVLSSKEKITKTIPSLPTISTPNPPDDDYIEEELRLLEQEEAALRSLEEHEMSLEVSPRPNDPQLSVPSIPKTPIKTPGFQAINEEEEEDEDRKVK